MTSDRAVAVRGGVFICLCFLFLLIAAPSIRSIVSAAAPEYDIAIVNGRVIDPESGLDAIRNIGISNGTIQAISEKSLKARTTILATGLVVAPGFIDLHSHGQDQENYRLNLLCSSALRGNERTGCGRCA
jgi:N-acyl-D-aspartate/D-glutamate deacylase